MVCAHVSLLQFSFNSLVKCVMLSCGKVTSATRRALNNGKLGVILHRRLTPPEIGTNGRGDAGDRGTDQPLSPAWKVVLKSKLLLSC